MTRLLVLAYLVVSSMMLSNTSTGQNLDFQRAPHSMKPNDLAGQWMVMMNWGGQGNVSWELWDIQIQGSNIAITQRSGQLGMIPGMPDIHAKQMPLQALQFDGQTLRMIGEIVPGLTAQIEAVVMSEDTLTGTWRQAASSNSMWSLPGVFQTPAQGLQFQMEKCSTNELGLVICKPILR